MCKGEQSGWGVPILQNSFRVCSAHIANLQLHQRCRRTEALNHMIFFSVCQMDVLSLTGLDCLDLVELSCLLPGPLLLIKNWQENTIWVPLSVFEAIL